MSRTTILYKDVAPGAAEDALFTSACAASFSEMPLLGSGTAVPPIATLEQNSWRLDGSRELMSGQQIPYWSAQLSGADCVFSTPPVIEIALDNQYTAVGLTLVFAPSIGAYCRKVNVKWYQQATLKESADFFPDNTTFFCQKNVSSFDRVLVTLLETNSPYSYAKLEHIIFGVHRTFDMTEIKSAKITNQTNLLSTQLPVCTLNWTLDSRRDVDFLFQMKQPMEVRSGKKLVSVYYIDEHSRTSASVYQLRCHDALGVLDGTDFPGGVYENKSARALLSEIVGPAFSVTFEVADRPLTGALLPSTKRASMQQVLFAWGVCATTDGVNGIRVFMPPNIPSAVSEDSTYIGTSTNTAAIVTKVRVVAHTYAPDESGGVEIGGVKYKDTQTEYVVTNPNVTSSDKQKLVEGTGATLISPAIGQETAQRVYDYHARRAVNRAKIVWGGEHLGDCVTIPNAWGGSSTGNVEKMDITLSNTVAASCETVGVSV